MLASINPLGERGRHQRYTVTVAAYLVASMLAAAALGGVLGFGGMLGLGLLGVDPGNPALATGLVAAVAALGLVLDAARRVPGPHRQVDDRWLTTYRGWVYGAGFGAQLGLGFTTIVVTSATWIAFASAALSGSPPAGALVGGTFGLARALPILTTARIAEPAALRALVRRLDGIRPRVAVATVVAQVVATVTLAVVALANSSAGPA